MLKTYLLLFLLLPVILKAQTISGTVVSTANKNAIPNASVFLSDASIGNVTKTDGTFRLNGVRKGQYDLVVSCLGYATYHQTVLMQDSAVTLPTISLTPKVIVLKEFKVRYDPDRKAHLEWFKREFLGSTSNARLCTILNPEVIDLDYSQKADRITGSADDFLIIENKALGYRIKYLLKSFSCDVNRVVFSGSSTFEPMEGTSLQQAEWQRNRIITYYGSSLHFLRSCINKNIKQEGFSVFRMTRQLNPKRPPDSLIKRKIDLYAPLTKTGIFEDSLLYWRSKLQLPKFKQQIFKDTLDVSAFVKTTQKPDVYALQYPDCLYISYQDSRLVHRTIVTIKDAYALFDNNGILLNPGSYTLEGYWAGHRLADLLPVDYEPPVKVQSASAK